MGITCTLLSHRFSWPAGGGRRGLRRRGRLTEVTRATCCSSIPCPRDRRSRPSHAVGRGPRAEGRRRGACRRAPRARREARKEHVAPRSTAGKTRRKWSTSTAPRAGPRPERRVRAGQRGAKLAGEVARNAGDHVCGVYRVQRRAGGGACAKTLEPIMASLKAFQPDAKVLGRSTAASPAKARSRWRSSTQAVARLRRAARAEDRAVGRPRGGAYRGAPRQERALPRERRAEPVRPGRAHGGRPRRRRSRGHAETIPMSGIVTKLTATPSPTGSRIALDLQRAWLPPRLSALLEW